MTTKEVKEVHEVYHTVYVAFDGKQFTDENKCLSYEKNMEFENVKAKAMSVPHYSTNSCELYIPYGTEDEECWVMQITNMDDLHTISDFLRNIDGSCLDEKYINRTIIIRFGYDMDCVEVIDMEEHLFNISDGLRLAKKAASDELDIRSVNNIVNNTKNNG